MKELSLNILDIAENSLKAGSLLTEIAIDESENTLTLTIKDNGCGMSKSVVESVTNPFYTTRTTRSVGMGLPLLKLEAEMTGGSMTIDSKSSVEYPNNHGTVVMAQFYKNHIDYTPLGDVVSSIVTLIQGHPNVDIVFTHNLGAKTVVMDTREIRKVLDDVPINNFEVIKWIDEYMREQYLN